MKNRAIVAFLVTLMVTAFWHSNYALACSCLVIPRVAVYEASDVVVVGTVVDVQVIGEKLHAKVRVKQSIKGINKTDNLIEFVTQADSAQCGYRFIARERLITIAANYQKGGAPHVDNCMMYSLKRADRVERKAARSEEVEEAQKLADFKKKLKAAEADKTKEEKTKTLIATCLAGTKRGNAECEAVCPKGRIVAACSYNVGSFSEGDTCSSVSRLFAGPTGASRHPNTLPHDRCRVSVTCALKQQTLSAQTWARCIRP